MTSGRHNPRRFPQMPPPYPYAGETAGEGAPPQGYYYGYYPPMPAQQAPVTVKSDPGVPTIVWMGVGAILGVLGLKFWNFAKDGPAGMQQKLMASAMENMMKTQAKGINVPGMSNFPGMGGTGAPPQAPGGGAGGPIVDTTASPAPSRSDSPKVSEWDKKKRSNGSADRAASPATASSSSASDDSASKKSKSKSAFRAASPSPAADAASKSTVDAEVASESSGRSNSK